MSTTFRRRPLIQQGYCGHHGPELRGAWLSSPDDQPTFAGQRRSFRGQARTIEAPPMACKHWDMTVWLLTFIFRHTCPGIPCLEYAPAERLPVPYRHAPASCWTANKSTTRAPSLHAKLAC
eukprot:scaffold135626_cov33-Prasinocladus_malaysianus.AAC.1